MKLLDLTLDSSQANLALDEALIEEAESGGLDEDVLRLWQANQPAVIIGRSSRVEQEVEVGFCQENDIPILRRCSGGAAVVIGPGCLMYSVVLGYDRFPRLRMVDAAHKFVLEKMVAAVRRLNPLAAIQGTSDLTVGQRKFSGNSLRCKRDHLLYHGTLLCQFPLELISNCLRTPPRQPEYRDSRPHHDFLINLDSSLDELRLALIESWDPHGSLKTWPVARMQQLVDQRYSTADWNYRL